MERPYFSRSSSSASEAVLSTALPTGNSGGAYNFSLSTTGGTGPFTWTVTSGSLPPGLTLSPGGSLTGTPTATGPFTFTVQVTDSMGRVDFQTLTLTVNAAGVNATSATGSLVGPNTNHTVTRLPDGRILLTGGLDATGSSPQHSSTMRPRGHSPLLEA